MNIIPSPSRDHIADRAIVANKWASPWAIIAASSNVDVSFVMAMQTVRMIAVLFIGPVLTKYIVTHSNPVPAKREE